MLLHALLDVAIDETKIIAEAFRAELDVLEGRALIKPDTAGVRNRELASSSLHFLETELTRLLLIVVHVLSGQLLLLKRALTPLSSLLVALQHHDEERALMAMKATSDTKRLSTATQKILNSMNDDVPGFLSKEARQYLSDVQVSRHPPKLAGFGRVLPLIFFPPSLATGSHRLGSLVVGDVCLHGEQYRRLHLQLAQLLR